MSKEVTQPSIILTRTFMIKGRVYELVVTNQSLNPHPLIGLATPHLGLKLGGEGVVNF